MSRLTVEQRRRAKRTLEQPVDLGALPAIQALVLDAHYLIGALNLALLRTKAEMQAMQREIHTLRSQSDHPP